MARWLRIFSPQFIASLLVFVGDAVSLALLRATVLVCTVGFNSSTQPLTAGQAAQCPSYEIASAVLVAVGLVAGTLLVWLGVRFFRTGSVLGPEREGSNRGKATDRQASLRRPFTRLLAWPTYRWVCLMVAVFFVATFIANSWGYLQLHGEQIGGLEDLNINQQALSSTLLGGKPYTFYEAFNCGRHGQCSFLQVHTVFIGFAVGALYEVAPTAFTLFAVQSLVVGLGALPLYALALDVIGSRRLSLIVAAAYLAWVPAFLATARASFHWEAFIPVEMLTLFWLWSHQRYLLAIPVVLLAFVTLEVTPVLTFFVGLFFIWPWLIRGVRIFLHAVFGRLAGAKSTPSKLRLWVQWLWKCLHVPEVYASLALMVASIVAYVLLRLFVLNGGWLLGVPPPPPAYALPLSSPNKDFVFSFAGLSFMWTDKLWFWIVVYLTLGFLPLLYPRAFLLVLPWIVFAVFNNDGAYWLIGNHYIFPASAALFIGFTLGLNRLYRWTSARFTHSNANPAATPGPPTNVRDQASGMRPSGLKPWSVRGQPESGSSRALAILSIGVVVIVGGNVFLNPLNPLSTPVVSDIGKPFSSPYGVSLGGLPSDQLVQQLVSLIPKNGIVAAPEPVFAFVTDDPYAFPIGQVVNPLNYSLLPDNESNRVGYVLLPYNTLNNLLFPASLGTLYDPSDFGVRGCIFNSSVGGVELFQREYTGVPRTFGPADPLCPNYFAGGTGLTAGPNATILANASSPSGVVVRSTPCATKGSYLVWTGPGIELPPGQYRLHVVLDAFNATNVPCQKSNLNPGRPLLMMSVTGQNASGFGQIFHHLFTVGNACPPSPAYCGWGNWNWTINLPVTTSDLSISGTVLLGQYIVQVSYLVLSPIQS